MMGVNEVHDGIINMTVKDAIQLKTQLEGTLGIQFLPTLDVRVTVKPPNNCGKGPKRKVVVFVKKTGKDPNLFQKIAMETFGESKETIEVILANGSGMFKNKHDKDEAESLKPVLEAVGWEVELK